MSIKGRPTSRSGEQRQLVCECRDVVHSVSGHMQAIHSLMMNKTNKAKAKRDFFYDR